MDLMNEIGIAATEQHVGRLSDLLAEGLDRIGARMVTPRDPDKRGPMIAVATTEAAMVGALDEDDILTTARDGNIRFSLHAYDSAEDIVAMGDGLERHAALLAR